MGSMWKLLQKYAALLFFAWINPVFSWNTVTEFLSERTLEDLLHTPSRLLDAASDLAGTGKFSLTKITEPGQAKQQQDGILRILACMSTVDKNSNLYNQILDQLTNKAAAQVKGSAKDADVKTHQGIAVTLVIGKANPTILETYLSDLGIKDPNLFGSRVYGKYGSPFKSAREDVRDLQVLSQIVPHYHRWMTVLQTLTPDQRKMLTEGLNHSNLSSDEKPLSDELGFLGKGLKSLIPKEVGEIVWGSFEDLSSSPGTRESLTSLLGGRLENQMIEHVRDVRNGETLGARIKNRNEVKKSWLIFLLLTR